MLIPRFFKLHSKTKVAAIVATFDLNFLQDWGIEGFFFFFTGQNVLLLTLSLAQVVPNQTMNTLQQKNQKRTKLYKIKGKQH